MSPCADYEISLLDGFVKVFFTQEFEVPGPFTFQKGFANKREFYVFAEKNSYFVDNLAGDAGVGLSAFAGSPGNECDGYIGYVGFFLPVFRFTCRYRDIINIIVRKLSQYRIEQGTIAFVCRALIYNRYLHFSCSLSFNFCQPIFYKSNCGKELFTQRN
jgi:hypothetical protein